MSLAELLPAIHALPKAGQVQLLHPLIDGVAGTSFGEPPFNVPITYPITTDAAGFAAIEAVLAKLKAPATDTHSQT